MRVRTRIKRIDDRSRKKGKKHQPRQSDERVRGRRLLEVHTSQHTRSEQPQGTRLNTPKRAGVPRRRPCKYYCKRPFICRSIQAGLSKNCSGAQGRLGLRCAGTRSEARRAARLVPRASLANVSSVGDKRGGRGLRTYFQGGHPQWIRCAGWRQSTGFDRCGLPPRQMLRWPDSFALPHTHPTNYPIRVQQDER